MTDKDDGLGTVSLAFPMVFQLLEEGNGVVSCARSTSGAFDRAVVLVTQHSRFGHASREEVAWPDGAVLRGPSFNAPSLAVVDCVKAVYQNHATRQKM